MRTALALVLLAAFAGPATAQRVTTDTIRWSGTLAAGRTLQIENLNGAITVEPASGYRVELVAIRTARRGRPSDVAVRIDERGPERLRICVDHRPDEGDRGCGPHRDQPGHTDTDASVAFIVRAPVTAPLVASTVTGAVAVRGAWRSVRAESVNGAVAVEAAGSARVRTVTGDASIVATDPKGDGALEAETVNGQASVTVAGARRATIRGETLNGAIDSDFPVTVEGRWGPRSVRGQLNGGGAEIRLKSVNGSLRLRKAS